MVPAEIVALGADNPQSGLDGQSIDDTPEMMKLATEIDKLSSISAQSPVNWSLVEQCSRIILRDYVKHFQIAAYYGVSLLKTTSKLSAIADAAAVFEGIFQHHWEDSLPPKKRKKGRFNAVEYWLEFVSEYAENYSGDPVAQSVVTDCVEQLRNLDAVMASVDEDLAPNLRPLINMVERIESFDDTPVQEETSSSSDSESAEDTAVRDVPGTQETSSAAVEVASSSSPVKNIQPETVPSPVKTVAPSPIAVPAADNAEQKSRIAFDFLIGAAADLFTADTFNAESYLYRRLGTWLKIKNLPPNDHGLTRLPAPPEEIVNALEKLYIGNQFDKLILACEQKVTNYLYWLDLSFYSARSAEKLNHPEVSNAITAAVRLLLDRFPGVTELKFENGTPMCQADTKEWLASLGEKREASNNGEDGINDKIRNAIDESRANFENSAVIFEKYIKSTSGIDRMRYESGLAVACSLNHRSDLAEGIIKRVLDKLHKNDLCAWDQDKSAEILSYAFDVYKAADKLDEASRVLSELAGLSPVLAVSKKYTED